ncbi:hypothetical protein V8D89_006367 [Ganoderma adspersum]
MYPTTVTTILMAANDPDTANFPNVDMTNSLGAWLLGGAATFLLTGLLFHQTYQYFREYTDDRMFMKVWVGLVLVLETFISCLILHTTYFYLVQLYWDPTYFFLQKPVWSLCLLPIPGSIAALVSQTWFVRRVWIFAPKFRIIVGVAFILQTGNVACFTTLAIKMFKTARFVDALQFSWLATMGCGVQMTGDIVLTTTLIWVLHQSRTGMNRTDTILEVMIAYAISTGAVNCIVHILNVAFSIAYTNLFIYGSLLFILAKLYANTFLVAPPLLPSRSSLNTRKFLGSSYASNETSGGRHMLSASGTRALSRAGMGMSMGSSNGATVIQLKIVTEESVEYDDVDCFVGSEKSVV